MKITKVKNRNLYSANVRKPDGSYKKVYGKTKKEVREKAESLTYEIKSGKFVESNKMTFKEWNDNWIDHYLIDVTENTRITYKAHLRNHINPALGSKKIQNLTHNDIQMLIQKLSNKLSPKTVKNIHLVIHRSLRDAQLNGYIPTNPSDNIILPKIQKKEMIALDMDEVKTFLDTAYATEPAFADMFEFMILTGLRLGEMRGLRIEAYDTKTRTLKIDQQFVEKTRSFEPPKHDVVRTMVLSNRANDIIMKHIKEAEEIIEQFGLNQNRLVFLSPYSYGMINEANFRKCLKRIAKRIGKPELRIHDLRHTHATLLLRSGTDIKTIAQNMGHSNPLFTLNKYAHSTKTMQENAADRIDTLFEVIDTK